MTQPEIHEHLVATERAARIQSEAALEDARRELEETRAQLRKLVSRQEEFIGRRTAEMRRGRDEAIAASSAKSAFLANMSHEIRTPLTSIIGFAELLLEPDAELVNKPEALLTIIKNGRHLLQVINDILDLAKIETQQVEVEQIDIPMATLVRDIKALVGGRAAERSLNFTVVPHFPLPATIRSDPVRLKQILLNLCSNAIKFTPEGSVTLKLRYSPTLHRMKFSVADTGIGISKEQMAKLFQPFVQADTSTTRKFGGTGLGLTISKQLAQLIGGKIRVESIVGRGSRFDLELALPADTREVSVLSAEDELVARVRPNFDVTQILVPDLSGRVLLAEDGLDNQRLIGAFLKRAGLKATVVDNGRAAVEAALAADFDLILMDMQMPEMDGVSATRELRASGYTGPIIALTANVMKADVQRCRDAGCNDVLAKPVDRVRFYEVLMQHTAAHAEGWNELADLVENPIAFDEFDALAAEFRAGLPDQVRAIRMAIQASDWTMLRSVIHTLKGTAGSFGYPQLTRIAAAVDAELFAGCHAAAAELCTNLIDSVVGVVRETA